MQMTAAEIYRSYRDAKNQNAQIQILAELNLCKTSDIRSIISSYEENQTATFPDVKRRVRYSEECVNFMVQCADKDMDVETVRNECVNLGFTIGDSFNAKYTKILRDTRVAKGLPAIPKSEKPKPAKVETEEVFKPKEEETPVKVEERSQSVTREPMIKSSEPKTPVSRADEKNQLSVRVTTRGSLTSEKKPLPSEGHLNVVTKRGDTSKSVSKPLVSGGSIKVSDDTISSLRQEYFRKVESLNLEIGVRERELTLLKSFRDSMIELLNGIK